MDLPGGRVTFLLTDVEGSSTFWEQNRTAMRGAMARHDEIAAHVVCEHHGSLLKQRGEGDSAFAVFARAQDAVTAAYDFQRRLSDERWPNEAPIRVRVALYTGEADLRDADYRGDAVNRCGRLREIAHGGQVLLGYETAVESRDSLPTGVRLLDLGSHLLRGLLRPEHIYQLAGAGLASDFPPIQSPDVVRTNIPFRRNPFFVGRAESLARLDSLLAAAPIRPVAIVGMTGIGKTQLAVEYAHTRMLEFPGGMFWANARDSSHLSHSLSQIGRLLGLHPDDDAQELARKAQERLQRIERPALLICDGVTSETDLGLLPALGLCRIMITTASRHVVPPDFEILRMGVLAESASLSLLQSRRAAGSADDLAAARELTTMLGGLPLALALAAHHVERLAIGFGAYRELVAKAPIHLLTRARQRFISETGHDGSLYDAIAVSYAALEAPARHVLGTASCFDASGIPLDLLFAASAIDDRADYDDAVAAVVDQSLVLREEDGRISLHQLVRHFARGAMTAEQRRACAERSAAALTSAHIRANEAMLWGDSGRDVSHCVAVAGLCRAEGLNDVLHPLLLELGTHLFHVADFKSSEACLQEGLQIVEALFGRRSRQAAVFLMKLGESRQHLRDSARAKAAVLEALEIAKEVLPVDAPELCEFMVSAGYVCSQQDDLVTALGYYSDALAIAKRSGQAADVATCLNNIGAIYYKQGRNEAALAHFQEALAIDEGIWGHDHYKLAIRLNNVGRILGETGRWEEAFQRHLDAARIYEGTYGRRRHPDVAASLYFAGRARRHLGRLVEARRDLCEAKEIMGHFDDERSQLRLWIEDEVLASQ